MSILPICSSLTSIPTTLYVFRSGQGFNFAFFPYDQWWRRHRRIFSQCIPTIVPKEQLLVQQQYATLFLKKLLHNPADFCDHIR